jgi:hypothetical protein
LLIWNALTVWYLLSLGKNQYEVMQLKEQSQEKAIGDKVFVALGGSLIKAVVISKSAVEDIVQSQKRKIMLKVLGMHYKL